MNPKGIPEIECIARVAVNAWRKIRAEERLWGGNEDDSEIFAFDAKPFAEFVHSMNTAVARLITACMRGYAERRGYGVDEFNMQLRREADWDRTPLPAEALAKEEQP